MISAKEGFLTDSNELSGSQTMVEDQEIEMEQEQQQQESQEGFEEATEQSRGGAADDVNTLAGQAASLTGSISESGLFQSKIKQVASAGALPPMGKVGKGQDFIAVNIGDS